MVTGSVMVGRFEAGFMDLSALGFFLGMSKFMVSASGVAFASSMAALKVHWSPWELGSTSQWPSKGPLGESVSLASPVEVTVKVLVEAWAALALAPTNTAEMATIIIATIRGTPTRSTGNLHASALLD